MFLDMGLKISDSSLQSNLPGTNELRWLHNGKPPLLQTPAWRRVGDRLFTNAVMMMIHFNETFTLQWHHNGRDSVSNNQPRHCLLNGLFMCRSKKTSKLRVTGLWAGNSPVTGEFPAQMASNVENASIWWRHHNGTIAACCPIYFLPQPWNGFKYFCIP